MEIEYKDVTRPIERITVGAISLRILGKYFTGLSGIEIINNPQDQHFSLPFKDIDDFIEALQLLKEQSNGEKL